MPDTIDSQLWVLFSAALVMLMQLGFCMLESGLVRTKNTINVAFKNVMDFCFAVIIFYLWGYGLMFGASAAGIIGADGFIFSGMSAGETVYFIFQTMFVCTAATIISGAVAERMRLKGYLIITVICSGLFYPVIGHWIWNGDGWLAQLGFIDFAGSTAVHAVGGWMALAACLVIGPRKGRFETKQTLHSSHALGVSTFGVIVLFFGWLGFNGGSEIALSDRVPVILQNTLLGGSAGAIAALLLSSYRRRIVDLILVLNGLISGLVSVTANCHIVTPEAAIFIGAVGGILGYASAGLLERLRIDDVVGAFPAHCVPGIWGTLAVALFSSAEARGNGFGLWEQLGVQALGSLAVCGMAFGAAYGVFWLINRLVRLRVDAEGEHVGLNVAEHGASTEIADLISDMAITRTKGDFSIRLKHDEYTEIGQIAREYNRVLDRVRNEIDNRERIAERLRDEQAEAESARSVIMSSIEYAERIQQVLLPQRGELEALFGEFTLVYRPRDVVSGDFYWAHRVDGSTFVAVVDCTGHGVPGAFMSVIGVVMLRNLILGDRSKDPGEILKTLDTRVNAALRQHDSTLDVDDGMDVCLCRIDADRIAFAGARRPLYWTLADGGGGVLNVGELKGDSFSIGGASRRREKVFTTKELDIRPGLSIYLTTDGYVDQPNHYREPFDIHRLRTVLESMTGMAPAQKETRLIDAFEAFRGGATQRDDVTILGLTFNGPTA